jgi:hypothetical protein
MLLASRARGCSSVLASRSRLADGTDHAANVVAGIPVHDA